MRQDLYERSLYKSCVRDLYTRPLGKISMGDLYTRSGGKISMRELDTMFERFLYKTHLPDFCDRSVKISRQNFYRRSHDTISAQDLCNRPRHKYWGLRERSSEKTSWQDPLAKFLWQISIEDLLARSPWETCKLGFYEKSLHKTSLQDLDTRPLHKVSLSHLLT